jgi:hypothetical protein
VIYRAIGKLVVRSLVFMIGRRYARQLRLGAGAAAVAIGIAVYWANREVREG